MKNVSGGVRDVKCLVVVCRLSGWCRVMSELSVYEHAENACPELAPWLRDLPVSESLDSHVLYTIIHVEFSH